MRRSDGTADSARGTYSRAHGAALTFFGIDLVLKQALAYAGRTFLVLDMGDILVSEISES